VLAFPDLVAAASDPAQTLTAFLPNDKAFRKLVDELNGKKKAPKTEQATFDQLVELVGLPTIKFVLTYHLVPAKISAAAAAGSDGAVLPTLAGAGFDITVKVEGGYEHGDDDEGENEDIEIKLKDLDFNDKNPEIVAFDLGGEAANGFAHGINRVLRPVDLP
jgi:uncharacterized surface protein with fasciclin (FAS1) repeats